MAFTLGSVGDVCAVSVYGYQRASAVSCLSSPFLFFSMSHVVDIRNWTVPATVGESVMNSAMAVEVLWHYQELLALADAPASEISVVDAVRRNITTALMDAAWNADAGKRSF
jgi:hypothetical protein